MQLAIQRMEPNYIPNTMNSTKMKSADRILKLRPMEGYDPKAGSNSMVDATLFTGGNDLHAVRDPVTCHWSLRYDHGVIPGALRGTYTSFSKLHDAVRLYFHKRNIEIKEVID
jgi:hypothetical protein